MSRQAYGTTVLTPRAARRRQKSPARRFVRIALVVIVTSVLSIIVALSLLTSAIVRQARTDEAAPSDAIVVLGAAQWDGRPSATLRARLDHALDLYRRGMAPLVILTGGAAEGDRFSESQAGQEYLRDRGVPAGAMVTVDGKTSWESLQLARSELGERSADSVILVSDPFHMFRVKHMAQDLGLEALTSPTQTSPIRQSTPLEYRFIAREVAAYLAYLFLER